MDKISITDINRVAPPFGTSRQSRLGFSNRIDITDIARLATPFKIETNHFAYAIYRGQDGHIDYNNAIALMEEGDNQVEISGQALIANTIWHYARKAFSECGLLSAPSPVCIVRIGADGEMLGDVPNPPEALTIEQLTGGKFRLQWRYISNGEEIAPTGFNIYVDEGDGFDFDSPLDTVSYNRQIEFEWISDSFADGLLCRFCVRSYCENEGESQNTNFVSARANLTGPDAITGLFIEVEDL